MLRAGCASPTTHCIFGPLALTVRVVPVAIGVAIVATALIRQHQPVTRTETSETAASAETECTRLSIVVLPFADLGGDKDQEYFADGITQSLTTDLSRISGSFVIAHNTALTYKGKAVDVRQIGRELGVRYVMEGSVQTAGDRIRVNAQLIDAQTGAHLWAERFDKARANVFDMEDEITARLAGQSVSSSLRPRVAEPNVSAAGIWMRSTLRRAAGQS